MSIKSTLNRQTLKLFASSPTPLLEHAKIIASHISDSSPALAKKLALDTHEASVRRIAQCRSNARFNQITCWGSFIVFLVIWFLPLGTVLKVTLALIMGAYGTFSLIRLIKLSKEADSLERAANLMSRHLHGLI